MKLETKIRDESRSYPLVKDIISAVESLFFCEVKTEKQKNKKKLEDSLEQENKIKIKNTKFNSLDKLKNELDEEEVFEEEDEDKNDSPSINYGFQEEKFFEELFYRKNQVLDYEKLFYSPNSVKANGNIMEGIYSSSRTLEKNESDMISTVEAGDTFLEIQYAAAVGAHSEVSLETRRKFGLWVKFNPALFRMFETMYTLTSDVNYAE